MKRRSSKESLKFRSAKIPSSNKAGIKRHEGSRAVALHRQHGGELRLEITGPEKGEIARKQSGVGGGMEQVEGADNDLLLVRDGASEVVTLGEE